MFVCLFVCLGSILLASGDVAACQNSSAHKVLCRPPLMPAAGSDSLGRMGQGWAGQGRAGQAEVREGGGGG